MFYQENLKEGYREMLPGIDMKTLVYGEKSLLAHFFLKKGAVIPDHSHVHEQTGYLISGRVKFTVAGEVHIAEPGSSWCIPGDVIHKAEILEDAVIIEVFSPVREEYLSE